MRLFGLWIDVRRLRTKENVTGIVSLFCNSYYVTMLHFGSEGCLRGGVELGVRGR